MQGVLFGVVTDNADPDAMGRVQVKLQDYSAEIILPWIRVLQPFASADLGAVVLPEIDDHVLVLAGPGGVAGMVVLGSLYTGTRLPPALGDGTAGDPLVRGILTPAGNEIVLDDTGGAEKITIRTAEGNVSLVMDNAETILTLTGATEVAVVSDTLVTVTSGDVEVTGDGDVTVSGGGNVVIDGGNVEITGSQGVKISGAKVELG